ncbi:MAG TPA: hypothetical protein VGG81_09725, partial [Edaphobacter sp.]
MAVAFAFFWLSFPKGIRLRLSYRLHFFLVVIPEGNLLLLLVSLPTESTAAFAFVPYGFAVILSVAKDPEELH